MKKRSELNFDVMIVFALLFLFSILTISIVAMGSQLYQKTVVSVQDSYESQTSLSYVANKVRYQGRANVHVEDTLAGPTLFITETIEEQNYSTMIYYHNGYLCEVYARDDIEFMPASGQRIMELNAFNARQDGSLLYFDIVTTGGDTDTLMMSIEGGGAQ